MKKVYGTKLYVPSRAWLQALAAFCLIISAHAASAPEAMGAMLPVADVAGPSHSTAAREDSFSKTAMAETMAVIKEAAAASGLELLRIGHSSENTPDGNSLRIDCGFASFSLLGFCDFMDTLGEELKGMDAGLVSFSAVAESRTARAAATDGPARKGVLKVYTISLSLMHQAPGEKRKLDFDPSLITEYSTILRYCSSRYEISSALLSEHSGELALGGNFSLKGTKKSLIDFMKGLGRGFDIAEKGYGAHQNQLLMPFLMRVYFPKN